MNPLGVPFESYSHYGRWRTTEIVEDLSEVPVDPSSRFIDTGDPMLDGRVFDGVGEMMTQLASSPRVEQCFVRQVFRFFMGRPEAYEDACTLEQMHQTYRAHDGSFEELLVALLTSDTFLYPRDLPPEEMP